MKTKKFYQSWTFWVNVLAGGLVVIQEFANLEIVSDKVALVAVIVVNFILRFKTDSEVKL